jgi:hypothetical protein
MDEIGKLANQHILEWESRLEHIDEMMARAHEAHAKVSEGSDIQAQLAKISKARDELALDLTSFRSLPASELSNVTNRVDGLKASFDTVGLQLERVLTTIVGLD